MHKLIKKYNIGGTSTWSPYVLPEISSYMGINGLTNYPEQVGKFANNLSTQTDNLINLYANAGDQFSMKLKSERDSTKSVQNIKNIAKMSSGLIGNSNTSNSNNKFKDKFGKGMQIAGQVAGAVYDYIPTADEVHNSNDQTSSNIKGGVNKALLSGAAGPYGIMAGLLNMGIEKTGGFTDASKGLGKGTDTANMIASLAFPGAGWFTKKTLDYEVSDTLKQNGASYGGTLDKANTAAQNAGAKLLFGRNKANSMIASAKLEDTGVNKIMEENDLAMQASINPFISIGTQRRQQGGYQQQGTFRGKLGLKLERDFAKKVVKLSKGKKEDKIPGFKNGGAVNVIPDGALHKNKHHLENVDEKFEEVTAKGIPVITESAGGDITQHAEVEREEIIFNLDVTKQLEKLLEDGSDEAAIEAGKLLVHEILENTVDNTGLLNKVE